MISAARGALTLTVPTVHGPTPFAPAVARVAGITLTLAIGWSSVSHGMTSGYVDRFDDGTTIGWGGTAAPTFIADGGPAGVGDGYLEFSRIESFHLAVKNDQENWTGDWLNAGIVSLEMDVQVSDDFEFRLALFGDGGMWSTITPVSVLANLGWQRLSFDLTTADMVHLPNGSGGQFIVGTGVLADTLANVTTVLIRHDPAVTPTPAGSHPEHVVGVAGLDNITAVGAAIESADFNADGIVNLLDLDILGANWEATNATLGQGDANGDQRVDLLDLDLLGAQWEQGSTAFAQTLAAGGLLVPEPMTALLVAIGTATLVTRRRH